MICCSELLWAFAWPNLWVLRFMENHPSIILNYTSEAAGGKIMNNFGSKQRVDSGDKHYSNLFENDERHGKIQHITSKIDQIILLNW